MLVIFLSFTTEPFDAFVQKMSTLVPVQVVPLGHTAITADAVYACFDDRLPEYYDRCSDGNLRERGDYRAMCKAEGAAFGRTIFIGVASGDLPRDKFIDSVLDYVRIYADMTSLLALYVDHDVMISQVATSLVRTCAFEPKELDDTMDVPFEVCEDMCKEDELC